MDSSSTVQPAAELVAHVSFGPRPDDSCEPFGMPYTQFSKQERIGRAADWLNEDYYRDAASRHQNRLSALGQTSRNTQRFAAGRRGDRKAELLTMPFGFVHSEDDKSFSVVDSTKSSNNAPFHYAGRGGNSGNGSGSSNRQGWNRQDSNGFNNVRHSGGPRGGSGTSSSAMGSRGGQNDFSGDSRYPRPGNNVNASGSYGSSAARRGGASARGGARGGAMGTQGYGRGGAGGSGGWSGHGGSYGPRINHDPSYPIPTEWKPLQDFDLHKLGKIAAVPNYVAPESEVIDTYGSLAGYNHEYDRVSVDSSVPLMQSERSSVANVSTSADPVIRQLAPKIREKHAGSATAVVFATDSILSQLMVSPRSVFSWDIVMTRVGDNVVYLDRRPGIMDLVRVNENAPDALVPPSASSDGTSNDNKEHAAAAIENLSLEATYINANYAQQVVNHKKRTQMAHPSPFFDSSAAQQVPSSAHVYREWRMTTPGRNSVAVVSRSQLNATQQPKVGAGASSAAKTQTMTIHALNNAPGSSSSVVDWRQKLETQRGAVMGTEFRLNSCKIARWTLESLLADAQWMQIGFVARASPRDVQRHAILGSVMYRPSEIATQTNLSLQSAWSVLGTYIDAVLKKPEGTYLLLKDPNQGFVRLYAVPPNEMTAELRIDV